VAAIENVAVLFTDLVGSTELAFGVEPDVADRLRQTHFSALRRAIAASGGTEVKNLGDGLMVVFATASSALSCAVAMQQEVDRENRQSGRSLGLRVGLSGGEATREGDDYFGDPVVEAARLCARAVGGQIVASELVRAMAGRRSQLVFRSLGQLELKGLPEPVDAVEVGWEPVADAELVARAIPLPSRLALRSAVGFIGRHAEREQIVDALKRTTAGEGREVVLVRGEPGIGKTTLVATAAQTAFDEGACVLLGRCDEDLGSPYRPLAEALGHYVAHGPEALLRTHLEHHGGELARMVPALGRRFANLPPAQSSDSDAERYLLFGAVAGLLAQISVIQPLVLVLDDLQWADRASLQLLRHVVSSVEPMRLLVVGTYRDSELSSSHPLVETLAALRRETGVSRIDLKGLDDTDVVAFVEAAAGHDLDADGVGLAHAVFRETDGNPFFVGEVLRHLSETGAIFRADDGRWTTRGDLDDLSLPDSVREVIGVRLSRLGDTARHVLSLAAVIGRDFDLDLLASVTDRSEDELLDIMDAATAAALVREVSEVAGRYGFSHALIQHTLYGDLGATRRARAHQSVAEALESICGDRPGSRVGELAHHWFSATKPVDLAKALDYSRQAAEAALEALAPDEALGYYNQALSLHRQFPVPDPLLGVDLLIGLGVAQRQTGVAAYRDTLLEAARQARHLGATDQLVGAVLANSRGFFSVVGGIDRERIATLEFALEAVGSEPSDHRARLLALLAQELVNTGNLARRVSLSDQAVAMARNLDHPATLLDVLNLRSNAVLAPGTLQERLDATAEALALADRVGDPVARYFAAIFRAFACIDAGERDEWDRAIALAIQLADEVGQPILQWIATWMDALRCWLDGDLEETERHTMDAFSIGFDSGQPDATVVPGVLLLTLRWAQGRADELEPVLSAFQDDEVELIPSLTAARALMYCEHGRFDDARAVLEPERDSGFVTSRDDPYRINTVVVWSHVVSDLDDAAAAAMLLPVLLPHTDELGTASVVVAGAVATAIGQLQSVLGHLDEAQEAFRHGVTLCHRFRCPYHVALTNYWWARTILRRDGDRGRDRAQPLLDDALALAHRHGFKGVERRVSSLLTPG